MFVVGGAENAVSDVVAIVDVRKNGRPVGALVMAASLLCVPLVARSGYTAAVRAVRRVTDTQWLQKIVTEAARGSR